MPEVKTTSPTVTRELVIELAKTMPEDKLASWYDYGLFIQSRVGDLHQAANEAGEQELVEEFAMWEAASDEDWLKMERLLEDEVNGAG